MFTQYDDTKNEFSLVEEHIAVFILNSDGKFDGAKLYTNGDIIQSQTVNNLSVNVTEVFQTN